MTRYFDQLLLDTLSHSETELLQYILDHQQDLLHISIQRLAESAYTSPASIIRMCKKLNLSGFNDLKYYLREKRVKQQDAPLSAELKGVLSKDYAYLKQTLSGLSMTDLAFTADCLCSDKNIYLFARGMSFMPITYMHQVLLSLDRDCLCFIDPPLMFHAARHMTANDVVLIASSGGSTDGIQKAAQLAKEHQATVIALTSDQHSPLATLADVVFHCYASNRYLNEIDIKSRFTMMFVIDLILCCYFDRISLNQPSDPNFYINQKNW